MSTVFMWKPEVLQIVVGKRESIWYQNLNMKIQKKKVKLLKEWRTFLKEENTKEAEKIIIPLLLTVNAIAGGLRTTG